MWMWMRMTSACGRNKDQRARNNQAVGADSFHHQSVETQTQTSIRKYKIQKIKQKSIFVDIEKIPKKKQFRFWELIFWSNMILRLYSEVRGLRSEVMINSGRNLVPQQCIIIGKTGRRWECWGSSSSVVNDELEWLPGGVITIVGLSGKPKLNDQRAGTLPPPPKECEENQN